MQVGQPVPEAGAEVEEGGGRPAGDPGVAVGRAGGDALEEGEHAAHGRHPVEGGDEVHLGGAGVGEADVDARADERAEEGVRTVHRSPPVPPAPPATASPGPPAGPRSRSGPRMPWGSNAALIRRISVSRSGSSSSRKYACFSVPMPCSPEIAPPAATRGGQDGADEGRSAVVVGLEDRQVDVAVADVPAAGHQRVVVGRQPGHRGEVVGDGRAGHDGVDDVVGAGGLGDEERLLPGRDQLRAGRWRQHVDVERAEPAEQGGDGLGVGVEPVVVRAFEDDDEVGERGRLRRLGHAEVEPGGRGDAGHGQ